MEKHLLFVGSNELYVFCNQHRWIKIILKKGGEIINFENISAVLEQMPESFHFAHEPIPIVSFGKFNVKRKIREKYYAESE